MKSLVSICAEALSDSHINESTDKKLLDIFEPLMTTFTVAGGEDDQQIFKNGRELKSYIEDLADKLKAAKLKSTPMTEAEVIIGKHSLRDLKVQIALYTPVETTYYAHYNDTGRSAICGVNGFGPSNGGNPVRYDIPVDVAKAILRANGCNC